MKDALAHARLFVASPTVAKKIRSPRFTFMDQVGMLGKGQQLWPKDSAKEFGPRVRPKGSAQEFGPRFGRKVWPKGLAHGTDLAKPKVTLTS